MKHYIRQETITNAYHCLIEFNNLLITNKTLNQSLSRELCRKYRASNNLFYNAVATGMFTKISDGIYKPCQFKIEPIHARKAIEHMYTRRYELRKNKTEKASLQIQKGWAIKPPQQKIVEVEYKEPIQQKTFSLFWGLIKFNY